MSLLTHRILWAPQIHNSDEGNWHSDWWPPVCLLQFVLGHLWCHDIWCHIVSPLHYSVCILHNNSSPILLVDLINRSTCRGQTELYTKHIASSMHYLFRHKSYIWHCDPLCKRNFKIRPISMMLRYHKTTTKMWDHGNVIKIQSILL